MPRKLDPNCIAASKKLLAELLLKGGDMTDFCHIANNQRLRERLIEQIMQYSPADSKVYEVEIDPTVSPKELFRRRHHKSPSQDARFNFCSDYGPHQLTNIPRGTKRKLRITLEDRRGSNKKTRDATIYEVLWLSVTHPDLQKRFCIAAYGTLFESHNTRSGYYGKNSEYRVYTLTCLNYFFISAHDKKPYISYREIGEDYQEQKYRYARVVKEMS